MTAQIPQQFDRTLTLFDAVGVVVCAMIGSGIFIVSSQTAAELNSGTLVLFAWLIAGVMTILGALAYAELAASWPQVGGQYAYIRNAWGALPAFLYGWTLSFVIKSGSIAAVAIGFAKFMSILVPGIGTYNLILGPVSISGSKLIAVGLIVLLTFVNAAGIKGVARIQNVVTISNLAALVLIIISGLAFGFNQAVFLGNFTSFSKLPAWGDPSFAVLGIALVGPLFALDGWNNVTFIAAEIKKPTINLPLALIFGTGLTTLLYILVNGVYFSVLSLQAIIEAKNGVVGAALLRSVLGPYGEMVIAAIILIAAFGCVNSMILSGSRAVYALAQDGFLYKGLANLGSRSHVPEQALWVQAVWSVFLVFTRGFSELLDYMVFASLLFYVLTVAGLFILRKKGQNANNTYQVWGYPLIPLAFCMLCGWVILSLLILKPFSSAISLGIVMLGLPFYLLSFRTGNRVNSDSYLIKVENK